MLFFLGLEAKLVDSASLTVSGLETDKVNLESEKGNITLKNLRAEKISAISHGGNISCHGVTQGSINLETTCKGVSDFQAVLSNGLQLTNVYILRFELYSMCKI